MRIRRLFSCGRWNLGTITLASRQSCLRWELFCLSGTSTKMLPTVTNLPLRYGKISALGDDDPGLACIFYQMAHVYLEQSETEEAITCFEEYSRLLRLEKQRNLHDNAEICYTEGTVAKLKGEMNSLSRHKEAEENFERALELAITIHGQNHETVASILLDLGELLQEISQFQQALFCFDESIEIRTVLFGADHPNVVSTLQNIASVYKKRKEFDMCTNIHSDILAVRQEEFGTNDVRVADAWVNLGNTQTTSGRIMEATVSYEEALRIRTLTNGYNHKSVAQVLFKIGSLYTRQNKYGDAKQLFEDALEIYVELGYPEDHPKVKMLRSRQKTVPFGLFAQSRASSVASVADLSVFSLLGGGSTAA
ncbi:hypothetical protein THAPS_269261 [Thalassiosira pseudonana CCMP1335]|uniref:Kinesin light chain n=1 Tax=Thalassiosira pseudonana TaxID=35128 RepID=B5YNA9_THAPS|nr:hypothetical protein THAPS_269261 [Thalassiosira pseudonana CCMP1335]ACI64600.1 hypothetical protein THAPS_269261 [Thalassiosira pseudonana CCMP1335]